MNIDESFQDARRGDGEDWDFTRSCIGRRNKLDLWDYREAVTNESSK